MLRRLTGSYITGRPGKPFSTSPSPSAYVVCSTVDPIPLHKHPSADDLVEQLLRDQDYLLTREIKQRIAELNQLLMKAQHRKMKVEIKTAQFDTMDGGTVAYVDVKLFKQL